MRELARLRAACLARRWELAVSLRQGAPGVPDGWEVVVRRVVLVARGEATLARACRRALAAVATNQA